MSEKIKLELKNLSVGYNFPLLKNINLIIENKSLICLVGKNGSGKSTLLNTLAGVIKPYSGEIYINGINLLKYSAHSRSQIISFVPSKIDIFFQISVFELVSMGRSPYSNVFDKKNKIDNEIINNALEQFDLKKIKNKKLHEISDGERQKSMIARAFVQQTPIILLDEPTAFLDYPNRKSLNDSLLNLVLENNKILIFSSHDLEMAIKKAQQIWLCDDEACKLISLDINKLKNSNILEQYLGFSI